MEPLKVTLKRAKETKNAVRHEESSGGDPPVIGTPYIQKWTADRLGEPEAITVTIESAAVGEVFTFGVDQVIHELIRGSPTG